MEWMSATVRLGAALVVSIVAVGSGCHPPVPASAAVDGSMAAAGLPARVSLLAIACPTTTLCFAAGVLNPPRTFSQGG